MECYLMFHLDQDGKNGIILKHSNDLLEIDNYIINNFKTRNDLFNYYNEDIGEFCLDKRKLIELENRRNNHNRLGAISLFCKYQNSYGTSFIKIPIIYGNDKRLLSSNSCLRKIKEKLDDINILKKIFISKKYLLTYYEYELLSLYLRFNDLKNKKKFIDSFVNRIKKYDDQKRYLYFRSLMNLCSLNELELKTLKGNISLNTNIPINTVIKKESTKKNIKLDSYSLDDYFNSLIENNDYENLHKYYDIETIEKNTNIRSIS